MNLTQTSLIVLSFDASMSIYWLKTASVNFLVFPHRQLALKALNERLKRVEDQSAWPSMEDEDDDEDEEVRTDTPLLSSRETLPPAPSTTQNPTGQQESSIISFEDASTHS